MHGFGISGTYLRPTARLHTSTATNIVLDLPGYGRSQKPPRTLAIPALARAVLDVLDALGVRRFVLVGNSMGCPSLEVAHQAPGRVEALVLVSPAGGRQNQPLPRATLQLLRDATLEPSRMARVAVPAYLRFGPVNSLRLFRELTLFPALERFVGMPVRSLAVIGSRDPLMPAPSR